MPTASAEVVEMLTQVIPAWVCVGHNIVHLEVKLISYI